MNAIDLVGLIFAIIILAILGLMAWWCFSLLTISYGRAYGIGHSEPLEQYMVEFMRKWTSLMFIVKNNPSFGKFKDSSVEASYKGVRTAISKYVNVLKEVRPDVDPLAPLGYAPDDLPEMYLTLIFFKAIGKKSGKFSNYFGCMKNFFKDFSIVERYYEEGSKTSVSNDKMETMIKVKKAYDEFRAAIEAAANVQRERQNDLANVTDTETHAAVLHIYELDLLHNQYVDRDRHDSIVRMYNMRKSGGLGNWAIFEVYMEDYTTYIFDEKIKKAWVGFGDEVKKTAERWQAYVSSDDVFNAVQNLPFKIGGVEQFKQNEEHFIGILISIAKVFAMFPKVINAVISVISNPMKFIQMIIGAIIGYIIFMMYIMLLMMSFLFMVPAFVWVWAAAAFITIVFTALYVCIAAVYLIIFILDTITGGSIFKLLRCENLPNFWHSLPNFANGNKYYRGFLCNQPCSRMRFSPTLDAMGTCAKLPGFQPSYCPQQILYNAHSLDYSFFNLDNAYVHRYKPDAYYYVKMNRVERNSKWKDVYKSRISYDANCSEAFSKVDHIAREICNKNANDDALKKGNRQVYDKLMEVCQACYCKDKYINTDEKYEHKLISHCDVPGSLETLEETKPKNPTDVFIIIIKIMLTIVMLVVIMVFMRNVVRRYDVDALKMQWSAYKDKIGIPTIPLLQA